MPAAAHHLNPFAAAGVGLPVWMRPGALPHPSELGGAFPGIALADTAKSDVTTLVPADVYSALVLEALYAERQFAGVVAAAREDITREAGDTVQVPYIGARTAQGPISEGNALTANATTSGTYPIALSKYGDYDRVNREVFEDQSIFTQEAFLRNMAGALAQKVDQVAYDELETASPGRSTTLASAGVLTDLYDKVVDLKAAMLKDKVRPTHLIWNPDMEAQILKDTNQGIKYDQVTVRDGMVLRVAGLDVVSSPLANAKVNTATEVQAIVIDRTRALGEAWGRRPDVTVDPITDAPSDKIRLITWLRYGASELDTKAVGHVKNP